MLHVPNSVSLGTITSEEEKRMALGARSTSEVGFHGFESEARIANEIMQTVNRLGLALKLDQLTEGLGNCFLVAICQQMKSQLIYQKMMIEG